MIVRRYGTTFQSVELNFDSRALTEIGFRRDRATSIPADEFESTYARTRVLELTATAEGDVQDEAEQAVLDDLGGQIQALVDGLSEGELLVIESEQGVDYPKTQQRKRNVIVDGENRLHFTSGVEPPLRVGVYAPKD